MPGLPGIKNRDQDLQGMRQLFTDEDYRPDMLKIYPCVVMKESKLYADWKSGKFTPITTKEAADIIGIKIDTVKTRLNRAIRALKEELLPLVRNGKSQ